MFSNEVVDGILVSEGIAFFVFEEWYLEDYQRVEQSEREREEERKTKREWELGRKLVYKRNNEFDPSAGLRKTDTSKST